MIAKYIIKIILIFFLIFNVNAEEIKKLKSQETIEFQMKQYYCLVILLLIKNIVIVI